MPRPWQVVERVATDEGVMTLMQQGESDFVIRMESYILMSSRYHRSEQALGRLGCRHLAGRPRSKVLTAGLGMGYTLRAALDELPADARVTVAELNPVVVEWCSGPLAKLTDRALDDPRVQLKVVDVAGLIADAARGNGSYDAIVLDLYQGTHDANDDRNHPFFGRAALETTRAALSPGGVLAVWTEEPDLRFERRLKKAGFTVERHRSEKGGPRHIVVLAGKKAG